MTREDFQELVHIVGGQPINKVTLAKECIRHHRMHKRLLEKHSEVVRERNTLKRRLDAYQAIANGTNGKAKKAIVADLHAELARANRLLDIAYRRNQILASKTKGATE